MQWYHIQMRQDETLKMNGHLRSGSASEAVRVALGRERGWPVQETGRDAARAIDPENPDNWCKANGVRGPAWPVTKEASEKKKAGKKPMAKKKPAEKAVAKKKPVAAATVKPEASIVTAKKKAAPKAAAGPRSGKPVRKSG